MAELRYDSGMSEKSPRNKTLSLNDSELAHNLSECPPLTENVSASDVTNRFVNQDAFEAFTHLPDNFVDLLLVDPPYNLTKQYAENRFMKSGEGDYQNWFESWILNLKRCLKQDASIYVCSDWASSRVVQTVLEKHFKVRNRITWEREKGRGAKANWKNCSEDIWFATVSNDYYFDVEAVKLKRKVIAPYRTSEGTPKDWDETESGNYRLTYPSNLWTDITLPFWSMPENTDHPTQKPEKLLAKLVLASSERGDLVFDPFAGSGSTCVVANKLGRNYLGIEREPKYCAYGIERLKRTSKDRRIQGYFDGHFWERNSLTEQKMNPQTLFVENS